MKLTSRTDSALRLLGCLASCQKGAVVPTKDLAHSENLSLKFLQGIVRDLVKGNILKAVSGPKGGVSLAFPAEEISFLQVVEVMEGPMHLVSCMEHPESCTEVSSCKIRGVLNQAQAAMQKVLAETSLATLAE